MANKSMSTGHCKNCKAEYYNPDSIFVNGDCPYCANRYGESGCGMTVGVVVMGILVFVALMAIL